MWLLILLVHDVCMQVKVAVQYMRKAIQKKAHFDIMDLDTVQVDPNVPY